MQPHAYVVVIGEGCDYSKISVISVCIFKSKLSLAFTEAILCWMSTPSSHIQWYFSQFNKFWQVSFIKIWLKLLYILWIKMVFLVTNVRRAGSELSLERFKIIGFRPTTNGARMTRNLANTSDRVKANNDTTHQMEDPCHVGTLLKPKCLSSSLNRNWQLWTNETS